jgi:hypothetical protein
VHNDIANTEVQLKQKPYQRFWRYNNSKKEKGMLSNFYNHVFCSLQVLIVHFGLANQNKNWIKGSGDIAILIKR